MANLLCGASFRMQMWRLAYVHPHLTTHYSSDDGCFAAVTVVDRALSLRCVWKSCVRTRNCEYEDILCDMSDVMTAASVVAAVAH